MDRVHRTPFANLSPAQQAGILCNDPQFQKFAATRCGLPDQQFCSTATAEYLRSCCQIRSRRDLENNQAALSNFQTLRTEFDAWTGRIPTPR